MKVWAHVLVKNEERWLWYSVSSIVDHVDRVLLWDTGSTDRSLEIEKELVSKYPDKIIFKERLQKTAEDFTKVRQEMLEATNSDWFVVVDGDEIWWEESIKKIVETINKNGEKIESIVVPTINLVGDIFHYQEKSAGKYRISGKVGHFNLRAINRSIPGLHAFGPHGQMGWVDGDDKMIQDRDKEKIVFLEAPYMHTTNLTRAGEGKDKDVIKRLKKHKYEIGINFPKDYYYPEVFFGERPEFVPSPWDRTTKSFKFRALIETPLRKIKRRIWKGGVGY